MSCDPEALTPGREILDVPSKATPPMLTLEAKAVAVAAFPVQEPADPEVFPVTFPVRFPVTFPTKEVAVKAPVPELKVNELEPANDPELLN